MATYRTRDGDMLDAICLSYYGQADGYLESVLTANPGLADIGVMSCWFARILKRGRMY
jgi:phage tail protein X